MSCHKATAARMLSGLTIDMQSVALHDNILFCLAFPCQSNSLRAASAIIVRERVFFPVETVSELSDAHGFQIRDAARLVTQVCSDRASQLLALAFVLRFEQLEEILFHADFVGRSGQRSLEIVFDAIEKYLFGSRRGLRF